MPGDYTVIQASSVLLDNANLVFTYPQFGASGVINNRRPILGFQANPSGGSVTLEVELNGTSILTQTFDSEPRRACVEIVEAGLLNPANNTLIVSRPAGPGDITLSDVYIMYQT